MFISRTSRRRAERERRWRNKRVEDRSIVGLFPASHRKAESSSLCLCFKSEAAENSTCMDKYHPPFFHVSFPFIPVQKQRQMQHLSVRENTGKRVHNHQCRCGRAAVAPESVQAGVTRWNHITSLPLEAWAPSLHRSAAWSFPGTPASARHNSITFCFPYFLSIHPSPFYLLSLPSALIHSLPVLPSAFGCLAGFLSPFIFVRAAARARLHAAPPA